jgi:hypothetical protein
MNIDKTTLDKLKEASESLNILSTLHFSIYTSVFTINSVLFGVLSILTSLNNKIDKNIIFCCYVLCIIPMLLILLNFIFSRGNILKKIIDTLISSLDSINNVPNELKSFRKQQEKSIYIKTPYGITKTFENASIIITIFNIFFFLRIIYVSNV